MISPHARLSDHYQIICFGTSDGASRDCPIEGRESTAVSHRDSKEIDIRQLLWPKNMGSVKTLLIKK
jgi:hypothetical protein